MIPKSGSRFFEKIMLYDTGGAALEPPMCAFSALPNSTQAAEAARVEIGKLPIGFEIASD